MLKTFEEKTDRAKIIKKLLTRWIVKQETAEKAEFLLSKNPHIRMAKALRLKTAS
jgi:hypothetical protein